MVVWHSGRVDRPDATTAGDDPANPSAALTGRTFAGVLLDMDGTLISSLASVERCWRSWRAEHGVALDAPMLHGIPARQYIRYLRPDLTGDALEAAAARAEQIEVEDARATGDIDILPGAPELLAALADGGARWTIVTSCTRALFDARWTATGLPVPESLVTADQVAAGKPAPDPYLLGAERLGLEPADCLVVEDAAAGIASARAAGCAVAGVASAAHAELDGADVVVAGLNDLNVTVVRGAVTVAPVQR